MIRFIRYFISQWCDYDSYYWFTHVHTDPEQLAALGGDPFRNRFDYAWKNARIWWQSRDRYSRKCTGDCEACTLRHC